jgi:hypothetical protein
MYKVACAVDIQSEFAVGMLDLVVLTSTIGSIHINPIQPAMIHQRRFRARRSRARFLGRRTFRPRSNMSRKSHGNPHVVHTTSPTTNAASDTSSRPSESKNLTTNGLDVVADAGTTREPRALNIQWNAAA